MSDANVLRLIILGVGLVLIAGLYYFGRPRRPDQGQYRAAPLRRPASTPGERVEPRIGDAPGEPEVPAFGAIEPEQLELPSTPMTAVDPVEPDVSAPPPQSSTGRRPDGQFERIMTLYVAARDGGTIAGPELVVAAEKAGLQYGDMGIYHRLVDGRPDAGPVFSMANRVKPGHFDLARIGELRTPGLTFFMTLPGPLRALDAWDTMLPAAQRVAELLDAQVLDAENNALGRQTIQHVRDDLRAFDRAQERNVIKPRR